MRQKQDGIPIKRRHVIGAIGTAGIGALAGCAGAGNGEDTDHRNKADTEVGEDAPYEVWALDQGTDIGYIYEPTENGFEQSSTIDFRTRLNNNHGHGNDHGNGHDHDDDHDHDHEHDHDHTLGDPESRVEVSMETLTDGTHHFIPHVVHIKPSGTVTWTYGEGTHNVVSYHPETYGDQQRIPTDAEPFASEFVTGDEPFEVTFEDEGVYDYVCTPHEDHGMVGTVVVGWPDPDDQPGLRPPSENRPEAAIEQLERYNQQVRELLEAGEAYESESDNHDDDHGGLAPHMIDFSSEFEYAVVALHHGDGIAIVRTEDREIVASVPTGHHSHFAAFAPNDEYITVDAVDDNAIRKVAVDLETETFELVDEIVLTEEAGEAFDGRDPTCHYYTGTGYTYHSLGPSYHDGGLAIVDHEAFELVEAYTADEVAANCGVFPHPEESVVYLTAGLPSDPESGTDGVGEYFVMDAETHEIIHNEETRGVDAHGLWITPDGGELWITNRESNNGVIVDTSSHEIVEEIEQFGPESGDAPTKSDAPDILAASPDGKYMFAAARGPNPVTADPQAATGVTPGFFVLDIGSRKYLETIQPDPEDPNSDFHGIGVRPLTAFDGYTAPPVNTAGQR